MRKEVEKAVIDIDITKTWLYQEGLEKGMKEGLKEALLFAIQVKFGRTPTSIKREIMGIEDLDKLRLLKKELLKTRTLKEFEKKLKSLNN